MSAHGQPSGRATGGLEYVKILTTRSRTLRLEIPIIIYLLFFSGEWLKKKQNIKTINRVKLFILRYYKTDQTL